MVLASFKKEADILYQLHWISIGTLFFKISYIYLFKSRLNFSFSLSLHVRYEEISLQPVH